MKGEKIMPNDIG